MKKTIFILNIIFSTLIFAQNKESSTLYKKEYYDLLNYIPKNFEIDSIYKPENQILKTELYTINALRSYNNLRIGYKLTENDKKWLETRIDQIALALFVDGKRVLISPVGDYSGCPDKMIDTISLNNIKIIDLKLCHSCTGSYRDENFIRIFNKRMYSLMKIEPTNRKTKYFYGEFKGLNKGKSEIKLTLKKDRTFKFSLNKGGSCDFSNGLWKNKNDTLILNSKILNKTDSLSFTLSSNKWIKFNDLKFRLKKDKLIELNSKKRKFKKTTK